MNLVQQATLLSEAGLSVIPTQKDKRPDFRSLPKVDGKPSWTEFQKRVPDLGAVVKMFRNTWGIAIIGGRASGNLVQLDFEGKTHDHQPMEPVFDRWGELVRHSLADADIETNLSVCRTPSGGYHVRWRVDTDDLLISDPWVAARYAVNPETGDFCTDEGGHRIRNKLIETKNEGGYCLCPSSDGYVEVEGDLLNIPTISLEAHNVLMDMAYALNEVVTEDDNHADPSLSSSPTRTGLSPGDDFNQRGDHHALLVKHGWSCVQKKEDVEYWKRPGTSNVWSANWNHIPNRFHVFSSSVSGLEHRGTYDKFGLYTRLEHDGDFSVAAKALSEDGFGERVNRAADLREPANSESSLGKPADCSFVGELAASSPTSRDIQPSFGGLDEPLDRLSASSEFPEVAFRGIFRVYREAYRGCNEVCDAYHFAVLKTVIGSILGRSCYIYVGRRLYPNFYTCMLGPSGASRKGTALDYGLEILEDTDTDVSFLAALSTPEGLLLKLATNGEDDDFVASDTEGRRLLVVLEEYAALLKKARKQSSDGLIQLLTVAYDSPKRLDNPTRHSPLVAEYPSVSIVAQSTLEWLEGSLTLGDIHGGFANRFCYYQWQDTDAVPRPSPGNEVQLGLVADVLRGVRADFAGKHQRFTFTDEAGECVDAWYIENRKRILDERSEVLRSLSQRLDINVRRLSLLYAVLENEKGNYEIGLEQFEAALAVASYWRDVMFHVFSKFAVDFQSKNESRILSQVTSHPDWTKREVQRSLGREMSAKDFNTCVEAMLVAEIIESVEDGRRRYLRVTAD